MTFKSSGGVFSTTNKRLSKNVVNCIVKMRSNSSFQATFYWRMIWRGWIVVNVVQVTLLIDIMFKL